LQIIFRHILEDKSSPFKQCEYVTRNNSQQCLNAIPSNKDRGYCHSHMQVIGMIPKTERKMKPVAKSDSVNANGKAKLEVLSKKVSNSSSSSFDFIEDSSNIRGKFKVNGLLKGGDPKEVSRPKWKENTWKSVTLKCTALDGKIKSDHVALTNGKVHKANGNVDSKSAAPSRVKANGINPKIQRPQNYTVNGTKTTASKAKAIVANQSGATGVSQEKGSFELIGAKNRFLELHDDIKLFTRSVQPEQKLKPKNAPKYALLTNEQKQKFEELRQMRLTKSFQTHSLSSSPITRTSLIIKPDKTGATVDNLTSIPEDSINLELGYPAPKKVENGSRTCKEESRQEFLARVRQTFKSRYKTLSRLCKLNARKEKRIHQIYQRTLLSCAKSDPVLCAEILSSNGQYTDFGQNEIPDVLSLKSFTRKEISCESKSKENIVTKTKNVTGSLEDSTAQDESSGKSGTGNSFSIVATPKTAIGNSADNKGRKKKCASLVKNMKQEPLENLTVLTVCYNLLLIL